MLITPISLGFRVQGLGLRVRVLLTPMINLLMTLLRGLRGLISTVMIGVMSTLNLQVSLAGPQCLEAASAEDQKKEKGVRLGLKPEEVAQGRLDQVHLVQVA